MILRSSLYTCSGGPVGEIMSVKPPKISLIAGTTLRRKIISRAKKAL
jgi:hypothetical protein